MRNLDLNYVDPACGLCICILDLIQLVDPGHCVHFPATLDT